MRILENRRHSITIKRSEFIGCLNRCDTEIACRQTIQAIRKEFSDATHVCTAFITEGHAIQRSNDDGEPAKTAGAPMLEVLNQRGMENICACVVRYFGGVKLGAGGLTRAYGRVINETLNLCPFVIPKQVFLYSITFPYDCTGKVDYTLEGIATIKDRSFQEETTYTVTSENEALATLLQEATSGKAKTVCTGTTWIEVPYEEENPTEL